MEQFFSAAFQQYKDSCKLSDDQPLDHLKIPLNPNEKEILHSISSETWLALEASTDPVAKKMSEVILGKFKKKCLDIEI